MVYLPMCYLYGHRFAAAAGAPGRGRRCHPDALY
jgi:hypothetical protein